MKYAKHLFILAFGMFLIASTASAQPGGPPDDEEVPIDAGVSLLMGSGILYGLNRKLRQKQLK